MDDTQAIGKPFAGYDDFDACLLDQTQNEGHDPETAGKICGALQARFKEPEQAEKRDPCTGDDECPGDCGPDGYCKSVKAADGGVVLRPGEAGVTTQRIAIFHTSEDGKRSAFDAVVKVVGPAHSKALPVLWGGSPGTQGFGRKLAGALPSSDKTVHLWPGNLGVILGGPARKGEAVVIQDKKTATAIRVLAKLTESSFKKLQAMEWRASDPDIAKEVGSTEPATGLEALHRFLFDIRRRSKKDGITPKLWDYRQRLRKVAVIHRENPLDFLKEMDGTEALVVAIPPQSAGFDGHGLRNQLLDREGPSVVVWRGKRWFEEGWPHKAKWAIPRPGGRPKKLLSILSTAPLNIPRKKAEDSRAMTLPVSVTAGEGGVKVHGGYGAPLLANVLKSADIPEGEWRLELVRQGEDSADLIHTKGFDRDITATVDGEQITQVGFDGFGTLFVPGFGAWEAQLFEGFMDDGPFASLASMVGQGMGPVPLEAPYTVLEDVEVIPTGDMVLELAFPDGRFLRLVDVTPGGEMPLWAVHTSDRPLILSDDATEDDLGSDPGLPSEVSESLSGVYRWWEADADKRTEVWNSFKSWIADGCPDEPKERLSLKGYQVFKQDGDKRVTKGVYYHANKEDAHGEFIEAGDLEGAAWDFCSKYRQVSILHNGEIIGDAEVVESAISPVGYRVKSINGDLIEIRPGDWIGAVRWPPNIWKDYVLIGKLNAFSFEGWAKPVKVN